MLFQKKTFRYYYWLILEFIKKHLRILILSFVISFIAIIGFISFSPYIETLLMTNQEIIGVIGTYDLTNLPEDITSKITNGLLYINEKGEITPAIASSWEVVDKGKEYRFHLRNNLIWSDGKKFSTEDMNYHFKDIQTKVIDDKTIYFILQKPIPIFPTYLRKPIIRYPLIGVAGLYNVDQIKKRYDSITEISLSPNKKDLPTIKYKFYNNELQLISAYKRGDITKMTTTKKNVAEVFSQWKNSLVTKAPDYTRLLTLFYNFNNQFLKQKEIRQALIMAIDQSKFKDLGLFAIGPISPVSWAFNPDLKNSLFDKEAAEKIIKKSLTASDSSNLKFYTYYDYLDIADKVSADLKSIGLSINLNLLSSEKPDNYDFFLAFWNIPQDPDQYFFWHSTQSQGNIGNYKNVKVDKLLEDGRSTSVLSDRKKLYFEFQKIILDDPPAAFLYYPYVYTIKRK